MKKLFRNNYHIVGGFLFGSLIVRSETRALAAIIFAITAILFYLLEIHEKRILK